MIGAVGLHGLQRTIARSLTILVVAQAVFLAVLSAVLGEMPLVIGTLALAFAAVPSLQYAFGRPVLTIAVGLAIGHVGQVALLVCAMHGHPWQLEMHFYFFAVLAMLAGFCDHRILWFGAALIAIHHAALNFLLPGLLYPGGTDFARLLIHALVVAVEAAMLTVIIAAIRNAFAVAEAARAEVDRGRNALEASRCDLAAELDKSAMRVAHLDKVLRCFKGEMSDRLDVLEHASAALEQRAGGLTHSAKRVLREVAESSSAATLASSQVRDVADAGRGLAAAIVGIGEESAKCSTMSDAAASQVETTRRAVTRLLEMSKDIERVTGSIATIAAQTNLLALNATIEAARSGAAGAGFRVVAGEVKALADSTAHAAHEITATVRAIQTATTGIVGAVGAFSSAMGELKASFGAIAVAVREQGSATSGIAATIETVSHNVQRVEASIGAVDDLADQADQSASFVIEASQRIAAHTAAIRLQISTVSADIAA